MSRNRRWGIFISVVLVVGALGYLFLGHFGENLVYSYTPSEVIQLSGEAAERKIRVMGLVVEGSLKVVPDSLRMTFALTDGKTTIPVSFEGVPPDLFGEGQGAVVEGYWDPRTHEFHSETILAKHSEDYMPIELKRAGVELPTKDFLKTLQP